MYYTFIKRFTAYTTNQLSIFKENYNNTQTKSITITTEFSTPSTQQREAAHKKEEIFCNTAKTILDTFPDITETMQEYYTTFKIPKKTGGFREINAPCDTLKVAQQQIANLLYYSIGLIPHNAAYAYVPGRSHFDALKQHQENESKWFLKLDIKDFFPSCTKRLIWQQLHKLYPIALWGNEAKEYLRKLLQLCCLNGVLPQGSPASPLLSNLIFVQMDKIIQDFLIEAHPKTQRLVYTRYADDMCISAKNSFDFKHIEFHIQRILDPEFKLKKEKTRYGSSAGRNWNLGLMLNKDNKITTGAVNKRKLKAMICNFILAEKEDKPFTVPELQQFLGIINYAKQIEPDYINFLLKKYSTKYDLNVLDQIKYRLKAALR